MLILKRLILIICIYSGVATPLIADSVNLRFQESISLYDSGRYEESSEHLRILFDEGFYNGHILYNLGNALYRDSKRGEAISAWLAAKQLLPRNPDVHANLVYAIRDNKDKLTWTRPDSLISTLAFWLSWLSERELFIIGSSAMTLGLMMLLISFIWKNISWFRRGAWSGIASGGLLFLALLITIQNRSYPGAVVSEQAQIYSAPGERNTVVFELHEGAPVNIEHEESDWYRISLSDGKSGWIHSKDLSYFKLHS